MLLHRRYGLYQILSTVVHDDQPSRLALAAHLGIDRSVMTYLIDDLVEAPPTSEKPCGRDPRPGGLPVPRGLDLGILRVAESRAVADSTARETDASIVPR